MIELKNITFSYERREQGGLRNINLTVKNGECILLCGRSGCGKTTITRLVNGLIPRFYAGELTGQVLIDGKDIADLTMYKIAEKVGSVFQNPRTQFFNTDSDSEIAFGLENQGMPTEELRQRVETTAADLEIQSLRNRSLHALSGGEKQKVAFASVYAMNPDIYLLDEPSSNLDMDAIQDLRKHLKLVKHLSCHKNSSASVATEQPQARKGKNGIAMGCLSRKSRRNSSTTGMAKPAATRNTSAMPEGP